MKTQIYNESFLELNESNMLEIIGGEDTISTNTFWLSDLIKYLKSIF